MSIKLDNPPILGNTPELETASKWLIRLKLLLDELQGISSTGTSSNDILNRKISDLDAKKAGIDDNEVISGIYDFLTPPTIEADPTDATQVARKGYVDGKTVTHESTYDHSKIHTRKHAINSSDDHDDISASNGSLLEIQGNKISASSINLSDLIFISGTQPFSFYVAETSGGSPTRKITINNNTISF